MNYPKKPGFNLYRSRHCAYITYSVKTWCLKNLSICWKKNYLPSKAWDPGNWEGLEAMEPVRNKPIMGKLCSQPILLVFRLFLIQTFITIVDFCFVRYITYFIDVKPSITIMSIRSHCIDKTVICCYYTF